MLPPPCSPRWTARSQRKQPRSTRAPTRRKPPHRSPRAQVHHQHRKAEPARRSHSHPWQRHKRLQANSEVSLPLELGTTLDTLARPLQLEACGPSPGWLRERPAAWVRKRTLTSRFQPDATPTKTSPTQATTISGGLPCPNTEAPEQVGVAPPARAPRSPHQTRGPAASPATNAACPGDHHLWRPPPRRRRGTGAAGRTSGASSEEPTTSATETRGREDVRAAKATSAARTTDVAIGGDPITIMKREVTFEEAPGSMSKCTAKSSREFGIRPMVRQVQTRLRPTPPSPVRFASSWPTDHRITRSNSLAARSFERRSERRVPYPSPSPTVTPRREAVRRPPSDETLGPARRHLCATPRRA